MELKAVFKDFHPDNHRNANLQAVEKALEEMTHIENPTEFLISGFAEYCGLVLQKIGEILGAQPLNKILMDIEKVLDYVTKYQTSSNEKNKIVNDMRHLIGGIRSNFSLDKKTKKRKKGLFSFF